MIQPERIHKLNDRPPRDRDFILYWMQASQRAHFNHALELAVEYSNKLKKPIVALFGITTQYPFAGIRHYKFMLEGLKETQADFRKRGIQLVIQKKSPELAAARCARRACLVITDCGYTRIQRQWRNHVAAKIDCPLIEVESNVIVPAAVAAPKEQFTAAHFRPKITAALDKFMIRLRPTPVRFGSLHLKFDFFDITDTGKSLSKLNVNSEAFAVPDYIGGTSQAINWLKIFIQHKLENFALCRNNPAEDCLSNMSPYLHFGQVSPLHIALEVSKYSKLGTGSFLEELIVRRELGINFVYYNPNYDNFKALPDWARRNLLDHRKDPRYVTFTESQLEFGQTADSYWNAAQFQMLLTGKMHGYMRMYWGKKILEWVKDPVRAYDIAIRLNDKYELDGRDPNGYAGVAWCFGKHDRLWQSRPIFGKVRYMNSSGLDRKFDMAQYVAKIQNLKNARGFKI